MTDGVLVDIGITSAFEFFRDIAVPNHDTFSRQPTIITALNAAWGYWHLRDWYFWDHHPPMSRRQAKRPLERLDDEILRDCPEISWLRDLSEAWKHRRLHRTEPAVRITSMSSRSMGPGMMTAPIGTRPIGGSITHIEVEVDGKIRRLETAMVAARVYWTSKLLLHKVAVNRETRERMLEWCRSRLGREGHAGEKWSLLGVPNSIDRVLVFHDETDAEAAKLQIRALAHSPGTRL